MRRTFSVLFAGFVLLILSAQANPVRSGRSVAQAQTGAVAHSLYLSALFKAAGQHGIYGTATDGDNPAKFLRLDLIIDDGQSWWVHAQTKTDFSGRYAFSNAPALKPGERYYVRFLNGENLHRVRIWETRRLMEYTAGSSVDLGFFDVQAIKQISPVPVEIVNLPETFFWEMRPETPGASYELELADLNPEHEWSFLAEAGAADHYTLETLPQNFYPGMLYYWCVWIHTLDGGRGASMYRTLFFYFGP
jgi:hypothetical protein